MPARRRDRTRRSRSLAVCPFHASPCFVHGIELHHFTLRSRPRHSSRTNPLSSTRTCPHARARDQRPRRAGSPARRSPQALAKSLTMRFAVIASLGDPLRPQREGRQLAVDETQPASAVAGSGRRPRSDCGIDGARDAQRTHWWSEQVAHAGAVRVLSSGRRGHSVAEHALEHGRAEPRYKAPG